jgi:outer membrane protein TolC
MKLRFCFLLASAALLRAEVYTLTLREAVARAVSESPDVVMARMDLMKAQLGVSLAKDPFVPKVIGASGAAWTTGYPTSINGSPPSIFEARTDMSIFNRPQSYGVAQAKETARGSEIEITRKQEEIAYRTASLYLDAQQTMQASEAARRQVDSLEKVEQNIRARVAEGRELEIQGKRAALNIAKARQRVEVLEADQEVAERSLAVVLGYGAEDRVRTRVDERVPLGNLPESEEGAAEQAIANNKELRALESQMQAKNLEIRGAKAERLPQIALVAQYNLLAKYNFQDFFPTFQRHNGQLGAYFVFPLLVGTSAKARISQGEADLVRMRAQVGQLRGRIGVDSRKSFQLMKRADTARNVARLDLDVTRDQLNILLAQYDEGRTSMADVEQARFQENEKWIAYYDAQSTAERVKLDLLRQAGTLLASLE